MPLSTTSLRSLPSPGTPDESIQTPFASLSPPLLHISVPSHEPVGLRLNLAKDSVHRDPIQAVFEQAVEQSSGGFFKTSDHQVAASFSEQGAVQPNAGILSRRLGDISLNDPFSASSIPETGKSQTISSPITASVNPPRAPTTDLDESAPQARDVSAELASLKAQLREAQAQLRVSKSKEARRASRSECVEAFDEACHFDAVGRATGASGNGESSDRLYDNKYLPHRLISDQEMARHIPTFARLTEQILGDDNVIEMHLVALTDVIDRVEKDRFRGEQRVAAFWIERLVPIVDEFARAIAHAVIRSQSEADTSEALRACVHEMNLIIPGIPWKKLAQGFKYRFKSEDPLTVTAKREWPEEDNAIDRIDEMAAMSATSTAVQGSQHTSSSKSKSKRTATTTTNLEPIVESQPDVMHGAASSCDAVRGVSVSPSVRLSRIEATAEEGGVSKGALKTTSSSRIKDFGRIQADLFFEFSKDTTSEGSIEHDVAFYITEMKACYAKASTSIEKFFQNPESSGPGAASGARSQPPFTDDYVVIDLSELAKSGKVARKGLAAISQCTTEIIAHRVPMNLLCTGMTNVFFRYNHRSQLQRPDQPIELYYYVVQGSKQPCNGSGSDEGISNMWQPHSFFLCLLYSVLRGAAEAELVDDETRKGWSEALRESVPTVAKLGFRVHLEEVAAGAVDPNSSNNGTGTDGDDDASAGPGGAGKGSQGGNQGSGDKTTGKHESQRRKGGRGSSKGKEHNGSGQDSRDRRTDDGASGSALRELGDHPAYEAKEGKALMAARQHDKLFQDLFWCSRPLIDHVPNHLGSVSDPDSSGSSDSLGGKQELAGSTTSTTSTPSLVPSFKNGISNGPPFMLSSHSTSPYISYCNDCEWDGTPQYRLRCPVLRTSQWCSSRCLFSLKFSLKMDSNCPNAHLHCHLGQTCEDHATHGHPLSLVQLQHDMQAELCYGHIWHAMEPILGCAGATSQLFRVVHPKYGYGIAAKGCDEANVYSLECEHIAYEHIWSRAQAMAAAASEDQTTAFVDQEKAKQAGHRLGFPVIDRAPPCTRYSDRASRRAAGDDARCDEGHVHSCGDGVKLHVPLSLGVIRPSEFFDDVMYPFWSVEGQVAEGHNFNTFLLLSYHGRSLDHEASFSALQERLPMEMRDYSRVQDWCHQALQRLGVWHWDLAPRNLLWDSDLDALVVIDFESISVD